MYLLRAALLLMVAIGAGQAQTTEKTGSDSTAADTAAQAARRDSLRLLATQYGETYRRFPSTPDTLLNPHRVWPWQLHGADGMGVSRALSQSAYFVRVPFALESSRNRLLYLGYPTPRPYLFAAEGLPMSRPTRERGDDWLSAAAVEQVDIAPGGPIHVQPHLLPSTSPVAFLCFENGVFDENTLHVLFARPLTRRLSLGVSSNYRSLAATSFTHRRGNIYGIYRSLVDDTALVVKEGVNPLTREHVVGVHAQYAGNNTTARLQYRYLDLHNGRVYGRDSATVKRDTLHQYGHDAALRVASALSQRLDLHATLGLGMDVDHERRVLDPQGYTVLRRRGELLRLDGGLQMRLRPTAADTIVAETRAVFRNREFFHDRAQTQLNAAALAGYTRRFGSTQTGIDAGAKAGYALEQIGTESNGVRRGGALIWHAHARGWLGQQQASLYARRDVLEYAPPYAAELIVPARTPDVTDMYGADITLTWRLLRLLAGYTYSTGVDSASYLHAWPDNTPPYKEPHSVVTIAPAIGRLAGFTLQGVWLISDEFPRHKAQVGLAWDHLTAGGNEIIRLELLMDYWSERERVTYAGINGWHRSIFDVSGRVSTQIKSFRFFLNVDNILNRTITYVPGNALPGLTFRWGFNWYFQR
jgi:hypothetical protein